MTFSQWLLTSLSFFVTTVGALLMVLSHRQVKQLAKEATSPEGREALDRQHQLLLLGMSLLAAWLVIQCVALVF